MDVEKLQCLVCSKHFQSYYHLAGHINEHFINYTCKKCGKGFALRSRYSKHLERQHTVGSYPCDHCDKIFETKMKLYNHKAKDMMRYKCKHCPERFKAYVDVCKHTRDVHGGANPYGCNQCDKTFLSYTGMSEHIKRTHRIMRVRQHNCDICDKEFFDKAALKMHSTIHTKIKKYTCRICAKAFAWSSSLYQHVKIHSDAKDFVCSHCGRAFVVKAYLREHMKIHYKQFKMGLQPGAPGKRKITRKDPGLDYLIN